MPEGPEITSDGEDHISNFPRKVAIMVCFSETLFSCYEHLLADQLIQAWLGNGLRELTNKSCESLRKLCAML